MDDLDFSNKERSFLEVSDKLLDNQEIDNQTELTTEKGNKELSDDDENETIFKKSNSILLNSLFEECKSSEKTVAFESVNSEKLSMQNSETNVKEESENPVSDGVNNNEFSTESDKISSSSLSPIKMDTIENSLEKSTDSKDSLISNLSNGRKKINIPVKNYRPTLSEDSKLVKLSLPTNPINLMQSNAQFLNKSRNFFNFITEKSSNIMEKSLLSHNIAGRYNSILKLTDSHLKLTHPNLKLTDSNLKITDDSGTKIIDSDTKIADSGQKIPDYGTKISDSGSGINNHDTGLSSWKLNEKEKKLTEAKISEESCTSSESSSTDLTSSSETDLAKIPRTTDFNIRFKDESGLSNFEISGFGNDINSTFENQDESVKNDLKLETNKRKKQGLDSNSNFDDRMESDLNSHLEDKVLHFGIDKERNFRSEIDKESNFEFKVDNEHYLRVKMDEKHDLKEKGLQNKGSNNCVLNTFTAESQESSPRLTSEEDSEAESSCRDDSIDSAISKSPNNELYNHPMYLALFRDYTAMRKENEQLVERVTKLEEMTQKCDAEKNEEMLCMEKTIDRLTKELKLAVAHQESLNKEFAIANKERECMVMKYAVSEKQLIDVQRARDLAERRLKEVTKEHELLQGKLRQTQGERTRICSILDNKCSELVELQKQVDRLKEDINMKEVKLKWAQNKLKIEMDLQKEIQQKLEHATAKNNEIKEENELIRRETQETMRKFQKSEENKAVTLDQQLKEQQAQLILERHVTEDKENIRLQLQKEVESLKYRQQTLIEENSTLCLRVEDFENDRLSYESSLSNLKSIADQRQKEIAELLSKVSELENLKLQLKQKEQSLASAETEIGRLRQVNKELELDMDSCRQRDAQMLEFTQKLTDKNVSLQSEFMLIEAKNQRLEHEQGPLHERIAHLVSKVKSLEESLEADQKKRILDCEILAKHVAEQTQLAQNVLQKLEDSEGENAVLKRKHQLSLKEMTRELQHCRKRLEVFESASPGSSLDPTSRTGSSTSLNTGETLNGALSDNSNYADHSIQSVDRQSLIDKIIKLQKINVKKAEKIDFLEEHVRSLVEELQKKTKIIQNYILVENFDAMSTNERDKNKAELAKYGGIMASVYNHKVSDDHMTLELSLEINQKLQSVLEDTLLKNITLKDNIDTLGEEIAKLTMQIQQKQSGK